MPVKFADLFSGIGGFHAVGEILGWEGVYASEIDSFASAVYERNWHLRPSGDIELDVDETQVRVPPHHVLFAGFPCQPFSKSGHQRGMDEARGTLFWNIARTIEVRKPKLVLLENVRNLNGPRHRHEMTVILETLRELGYAVSDEPLLTSPHRIHKKYGGRPQTRERIYIGATRLPRRNQIRANLEAEPLNIDRVERNWSKDDWRLHRDLPVDSDSSNEDLELTGSEQTWIDAWDKFVIRLLRVRRNHALPGHPLWADVWLGNIRHEPNDPAWKTNFIHKNEIFFERHKTEITSWLREHDELRAFPPSRRKLEWQARDAKSLRETVLQLRPSGIRAKLPTYVPAAVAITQTSVLGDSLRRLSPTEVARLQGLPDWFDFGDQAAKHTYKQLGNGISIACAYHALRALVDRDRDFLMMTNPEIVQSVEASHPDPDRALRRLKRKKVA
jgi:DNA (cytosine-5)-methyltransferase 1